MHDKIISFVAASCLLAAYGNTDPNGSAASSITDSAASSFTSSLDGKCLDVRGDSQQWWTQLQEYDCNSSGAQIFHLRTWAEGFFNIVNSESGLCVDIASSGTANGTKVQMFECNNTSAQTLPGVRTTV